MNEELCFCIDCQEIYPLRKVHTGMYCTKCGGHNWVEARKVDLYLFNMIQELRRSIGMLEDMIHND